MKSDHIEGDLSFALVRTIAYTLRPILSASSCICISHSDSLGLSDHNVFRFNQSATPRTSHFGTKLGVPGWMSGHSCCLALDGSQP
jgi:hypothetical protein